MKCEIVEFNEKEFDWERRKGLNPFDCQTCDFKKCCKKYNKGKRCKKCTKGYGLYKIYIGYSISTPVQMFIFHPIDLFIFSQIISDHLSKDTIPFSMNNFQRRETHHNRDRKSTRLNSSHVKSRMPSSA